MRKILPDTESRAAKGSRRGGRRAAPAAVPPPPGQGKRGESGYLGYLLRQAQAAARLSLERALAELGATPPQFVVLTMLNAYTGLSGRRPCARRPPHPTDDRRHHQESRARRCDQKDPAPRARSGAAMDADPTRPDLAAKLPQARHCARAEAGGEHERWGTACDPSMAVRNC